MKPSTTRPLWWLALLAGIALFLTPLTVFGQEPEGSEESQRVPFPSHGFLITGYGSAGYDVLLEDDGTPNDFTAAVNPLLLFQISDQFLFESELEFELEEGVTETGLEYAQIDWSPLNNLKVVAGKFLLPFNAFSERLHPSWINKFPSAPPLYGHDVAGGPTAPLLPILSDVGAQVRVTFDVGRFGYVTGDAFVTQGPNVEADHEESEEEMPEDEEGLEIPELAFGRNFADNNAGKMVGGRAGLGVAPYFEINFSVMSGDYDDDAQLRFTAFGAHVEGRYRGLELHGEWIRTEQDVAPHAEEAAEVMSLNRDGYFLQAGYQIGKWEPLVRWTQIFDGDIAATTVVESGEQLGLGLTYWLRPSLAAKVAYLVNLEDAELENNRLAVQWAFGF